MAKLCIFYAFLTCYRRILINKNMHISKRNSKEMEDEDKIKRKILKCCERLSREAEELYVGSSVTELDGGEPISALEFYRDRTPVLGCIACVNCVKILSHFCLSFSQVMQ